MHRYKKTQNKGKYIIFIAIIDIYPHMVFILRD